MGPRTAEQSEVSLKALGPADKARFVEVILEAFAADPLFVELFKNSQQDKRAFVSFLFDKSMALEDTVMGLFDGEHLEGCFVLEGPQQPSLQQWLRLLPAVPRLLRAVGLKRVKYLNSYKHLTRQGLPKTSHYLTMIGVRSDAQGRGFGRKMLEEVLAQVDSHPRSSGVGLDTENRGNLALYQRFGFALRATQLLERRPLYCMFRPSGKQ